MTRFFAALLSLAILPLGACMYPDEHLQIDPNEPKAPFKGRPILDKDRKWDPDDGAFGNKEIEF